MCNDMYRKLRHCRTCLRMRNLSYVSEIFRNLYSVQTTGRCEAAFIPSAPVRRRWRVGGSPEEGSLQNGWSQKRGKYGSRRRWRAGGRAVASAQRWTGAISLTTHPQDTSTARYSVSLPAPLPGLVLYVVWSLRCFRVRWGRPASARRYRDRARPDSAFWLLVRARALLAHLFQGNE